MYWDTTETAVKCPKCQDMLIEVDGLLFCLTCEYSIEQSEV